MSISWKTCPNCFSDCAWSANHDSIFVTCFLVLPCTLHKCAYIGVTSSVSQVSCWVLLLLLCCAVLCCAVLCCAVLCCAVLCCAVLCCAVLCCAVLCCVVSQPDILLQNLDASTLQIYIQQLQDQFSKGHKINAVPEDQQVWADARSGTVHACFWYAVRSALVHESFDIMLLC